MRWVSSFWFSFFFFSCIGFLSFYGKFSLWVWSFLKKIETLELSCDGFQFLLTICVFFLYFVEIYEIYCFGGVFSDGFIGFGKKSYIFGSVFDSFMGLI